MKAARNVAIIPLLALIVAAVPGGGNAADAILAAISLSFLALIGFAGYQLYRQNRLTYLGLTDGQRAMFVGAARRDRADDRRRRRAHRDRRRAVRLDRVIAVSVITLVKVWGDARASY